MSEFVDYANPREVYPPGFRARRGLNWGVIGLTYASYYLCRYNFSYANESIGAEFALDTFQMGLIISSHKIAYAVGQMVNGFITDRIGGRRAMLTGVVGTVLLNVLFGLSSFWASPGTTKLFMLGAFMTIWGLNGYIQSFGAPGMIKINTSWFHKTERGRFAGIFGFMINLGRWGIGVIAPAILYGCTLFWLIKVPPQHWRWTFFVPAVITAVIGVVFYLAVKNSREEAGFPQDAQEPEDLSPDPTVRQLFRAICYNPVVWITAVAYFCTGVVRGAVDDWFPLFVRKAYNVDLKSSRGLLLSIGIPLVATLGSLISGYVSDVFFKGKRAPVAGALYLIETCVIFAAAWLVTANNVVMFLILIAFTANATHSILGTAAAMDIGGKKMAGFASGVIDSFQYYGGFLAGGLLGWLIKHYGWGSYFYFMAPWGLLGALMMLIAHRRSMRNPPASPPGGGGDATRPPATPPVAVAE